MKKPTKEYEEETKRILKSWKKMQKDNEARMREPNIDPKSIVIALGCMGFMFGLGVIVCLKMIGY
jgi:hypothetical protein